MRAGNTSTLAAFLPLRPSPSPSPGSRDWFCESTVQRDNTGRSASDQGAADGARGNSITHYLKQMSHHYSGPDWGFPRGDARLDLTDLYAFPKPGDAGKSILVMNVHPSAHDYLDRENPLGPTTTEAFAPELRDQD